MKDKTRKRLRYSNRKHAFRNKRFKIHKNITKVENNLSNYNSKSVNIKRFSEIYIK